jgi:predicted amidohydrolase YtcJ
MGTRNSSGRMGRRDFLGRLWVLCAGLIAGCGRSQSEPTPVPSLPTSTQRPAATYASAAPPTVAPTAAEPTPTSLPASTSTLQPTPMPSAATAPSPTPISLEGPADTALINGKVITVDASDAIAEAVTIKNGLIQAVGTTDELRSRISAETQVVDLKGQALTPGLIDSHCHLQLMGMFSTYFTPLVPPEVRTLSELQNKLGELVTKTPKGQWIKPYYLTAGQGITPKRQDLDAVSPDHPVWLMQQGGHYGTANSLALKMAGITAATSNPSGGLIERDSTGEPTGILYNHPAMDLVRQYIEQVTMDDVRGYISYGQELLAACGVTSFQDTNVRDVDVVNTYLETGRQGKMVARGAVYFTLERPRDLNTALKELQRYEDPFMRFAGFKFLLDGQAPTAYCHEPHNGVAWDMPAWDPATFKRQVRTLHDTGLQMCVHCCGDAAVDLTLDAYEEAMRANPRPDPRHRIEHAIVTTPQATQRMRDLGVVVGVHPNFIRIGGDGYLGMFGEERFKRVIVSREWLDGGVHIALGSDAPTTPWYTPQMSIWGGVARVAYSGQVIGEEQRMSVQEALRAHTMGAAYAAHEEHIKGSIDVGKLADLAVWQEDPYRATPERLRQIAIDMTIIGGKTVYQA